MQGLSRNQGCEGAGPWDGEGESIWVWGQHRCPPEPAHLGRGDKEPGWPGWGGCLQWGRWVGGWLLGAATGSAGGMAVWEWELLQDHVAPGEGGENGARGSLRGSHHPSVPRYPLGTAWWGSVPTASPSARALVIYSSLCPPWEMRLGAA